MNHPMMERQQLIEAVSELLCYPGMMAIAPIDQGNQNTRIYNHLLTHY